MTNLRHRPVAVIGTVLAVALLAACVADPPTQAQEGAERRNTVWVVSNDWHAEIAIPQTSTVATALLPEALDFPDAAFLSFGWGDRVYYQAPATTIGMALRAALTATPAVMHVTGYRLSPDLEQPDLEILSFALTDPEFRDLVRAISETFERPDSGEAPASRGLNPRSRFYNANGTFHLFNTCNTWTARMLRAGGVPVSPAGITTAEDLMARLRKIVPAR